MRPFGTNTRSGGVFGTLSAETSRRCLSLYKSIIRERGNCLARVVGLSMVSDTRLDWVPASAETTELNGVPFA